MENTLFKCAVIVCVVTAASSASAEVITIGKGSGVIWEGLPFNKTLYGALGSPRLRPQYGLLSISNSSTACMSADRLQNIAGYMALPLGSNNVGLVPRATGKADYYRFDRKEETLSGTIGLPETRGSTTAGTSVTSPSGTQWCLPPDMTESEVFYASSYQRTATLSGTWIIVANGQQTNSEVKLGPMFFGSYSTVNEGDKSVSILPSNITLRISSLECTVNTPVAINFQGVLRNTQAGAELALLSNPLITTCGQENDKINANINLQFRALTGVASGNNARLSLRQGGGWVTGEINNGVTGTGTCNSSAGIRFDNTPVKIGSISSSEATKTLNNQVTWRLCSGGADLPEGPVDASAEMLVTFN